MKNRDCDLKEYQAKKLDYYNQLTQSHGAERGLSVANEEALLKKLYLFMLKNLEDRTIGPKKFAYDITGTMFCKVAYKKFSGIIDLAGELELPNRHIDGDPRQKMKQLITLIKNL